MTISQEQLEQSIITQLKTIYDPEIPVDIYELGLIYEINFPEPDHAEIVMTLTSPNCPAAEHLPQEVEEKVGRVEGLKKVTVRITFDPPWSKDMMSEEAQLELGLL
ncbi:MAG: iron-sulfur cluster assembly protein [Flavobacteriales bacterium]|nr:iron-sulfur cluster assembly protein [Flavobacteriales bacterium]MCX7768986.1 iron-sulfur cluster assembly protein [Flavobacteriales bacterium]MDW8410267.1 iron-sulfur cluster assembly protein [Flavobacteriales bacterium]